MRALAKELVDLQPDVILASNTPATGALQRETHMIPIVFQAADLDWIREAVNSAPDWVVNRT
jgi:ABC-type uncharacterized transport system substrate-binding protein